MQSQYSTRSPAVKRLMKEAQELKAPTEQYFAQPLEDNLFEWHFTIRGPSDSEFEGGVYHGRIVLPAEYPMKPPSIIMLTTWDEVSRALTIKAKEAFSAQLRQNSASANGRFELNTKICLSISGYHPESWQPSWSIRTALLAIIGFMPSQGNGAIGSLDHSPEERKRCAKRSQSFKCDTCGAISELLLPVSSASKELEKEAKALGAQIQMQDEKSLKKQADRAVEESKREIPPPAPTAMEVSAAAEPVCGAPTDPGSSDGMRELRQWYEMLHSGAAGAPAAMNELPGIPSATSYGGTYDSYVAQWNAYLQHLALLPFDPLTAPYLPNETSGLISDPYMSMSGVYNAPLFGSNDAAAASSSFGVSGLQEPFSPATSPHATAAVAELITSSESIPTSLQASGDPLTNATASDGVGATPDPSLEAAGDHKEESQRARMQRLQREKLEQARAKHRARFGSMEAHQQPDGRASSSQERLSPKSSDKSKAKPRMRTIADLPPDPISPEQTGDSNDLDNTSVGFGTPVSESSAENGGHAIRPSDRPPTAPSTAAPIAEALHSLLGDADDQPGAGQRLGSAEQPVVEDATFSAEVTTDSNRTPPPFWYTAILLGLICCLLALAWRRLSLELSRAGFM